MLIDTQQTPLQNVLALINTTNATSLSTDEIDLSAPSAWTDPESNSVHNTAMTLTAKENTEYTGSVEIYYTRLDFDALRSGADVEFTNTPATTLDDIRSAVADQLGVIADQIEFDVAEAPTVPDGEDFVVINASAVADSLLYIGTVSVTVWPVQAPLENTITTTEMDGFDYPA